MSQFSVFLGSALSKIPQWILSRTAMTLFLMFGTKMIFDNFQTTAEEEAFEDYMRTQKLVANKKVYFILNIYF